MIVVCNVDAYEFAAGRDILGDLCDWKLFSNELGIAFDSKEQWSEDE